jgi:Cu-Zn family superoxide dismutase
MRKKTVWLTALLPLSMAATAAEVTVTLNQVDAKGVGAAIGQVRIVENKYGLVFYPQLAGLQPGGHGFHVHENPSCASADSKGVMMPAQAAGGHLDPQKTGAHGEPWGAGHLGDLPELVVAADGTATNPVLAPRLKLSDVKNHALMVHAGGDNHADQPAPLGGGGARVACGVIGS